MKKLKCAKCGGMKKYQEGGGPDKPTANEIRWAKEKKERLKTYTPDGLPLKGTSTKKTGAPKKVLKGVAAKGLPKRKLQMGGTSGIEMPKYSNNPNTAQGRILMKGGVTKSKKMSLLKRTSKK
jgi:hypothetical protein